MSMSYKLLTQKISNLQTHPASTHYYHVTLKETVAQRRQTNMSSRSRIKIPNNVCLIPKTVYYYHLMEEDDEDQEGMKEGGREEKEGQGRCTERERKREVLRGGKKHCYQLRCFTRLKERLVEFAISASKCKTQNKAHISEVLFPLHHCWPNVRK